jgi:hypothetical protein
VTACPEDHPPHCWLHLPKKMWSFLLCNCITPAPTSDHFLTKVLSCWHHKNLVESNYLNHGFEHCDHQLCERDPSLLANKFRTESLNDVAQITKKKLCTIIWKSFSSLFSESFQIQDSTSSRYRAPMPWEEREKETIPEKKSLKKVFLPQISTESRYFWVDFKEQRWETEKGNT